MYCASLRLWPCKRSLVARALSLPTPALEVNTPPRSPSRQQTTSSFRSSSVTLKQLLLLLAIPSQRPFCTAPPPDPSLQGASRKVDSGSTKKGRPAGTGTTQAEDTRSPGDVGGEERSSSAAEVDEENENTTATSSSPPFGFPEKGPHQTFHLAAAPGEQQPQPRSPQPNDKTERPPTKSAHAIAMEEFAALERKLAVRSAASPAASAPPTASRSPRAEEVTTNTESSSGSINSGSSSSSNNSSNGCKEKRRTAEQVAMEEFAALERKLGSAGGGGDPRGPEERSVSSSRNPRSSAAAASARPKVRLLRGTIVNRTYGTHKNLYIYPCLLPLFGPIYYGPPL